MANKFKSVISEDMRIGNDTLHPRRFDSFSQKTESLRGCNPLAAKSSLFAAVSLDIPLHDKQHRSDAGVGHSLGDGGHDGVILDGDGVPGSVTLAGHIAAGLRGGKELLAGGAAGDGVLGSAAAQGDGEAQLVAVHLLAGQRGLVAEGGETPAAGGFQGDGGDPHRAVGVVDDLGIGGGGHGAVGTDGDGQHGGDGDRHGRGGRITIQGTVHGGGQVDSGGCGVTGGGDVRPGGGGKDSKAENGGQCQTESDEFLAVFHGNISPF